DRAQDLHGDGLWPLELLPGLVCHLSLSRGLEALRGSWVGSRSLLPTPHLAPHPRRRDRAPRTDDALSRVAWAVPATPRNRPLDRLDVAVCVGHGGHRLLDAVPSQFVSAAVLARVPPDTFVRELWSEVERHPAVAHPFLRRFAEGGLARWQLCGYASPHYQLVGPVTAYLEAIAGRTPDPEVRRLFRDILDDEYMRPQAFERSRPALLPSVHARRRVRGGRVGSRARAARDARLHRRASRH